MFSQALINTDISKLLYLQQFPYQNKAHDLISSDFIEISLKHIDKMQSKKYHTVELIPNSKRKIVKTGTKQILPNTHIHDTYYFIFNLL
jgi:hypothetical protein